MPTHFVYVEWFSRLRAQPESWHKLYRVDHSVINNARVQNERAACILPLERVQRSVSLLPSFGRRIDPTWTAENVLQPCTHFYVDAFSDKHAYVTMP